MKKRNIRNAALIISVLVIIIIGSTLAYFTSVDKVTNRFVAGKLDITLNESNWKPESGVNVIPGDVIEKNPVITSNENAECYLFMRVKVPCYSPEIEYDSGNDKGMVRPADKSFLPMYKFIISENGADVYDNTTTWNQNVYDCWRQVGEPVKNGEQLIYIYGYVDSSGNLIQVKKGETTEKPLFDKIKVCNFNEKYLVNGSSVNRNYNVIVEAFGIQSAYLSAGADNIDDVWKIVDSGK